MWSMYKLKRYSVYITLTTIPLLVFIMLFFMMGMKHVKVENYVFVSIDIVNTMISLAAAVLVGAVVIMIGNKLMQHPFLKMLEQKGLITFILDSTGLIGLFNVIVNAPKVSGVHPGSKNLEIEETYDVDLLHRLLIPRDAPLTTGYYITQDDTGKLKLVEKKVLVLPDDDTKFDHLFSFESRPCFIYNKVTRSFLSREALASGEKYLMLKHSALNILYKIQEISSYFRDFGRYAGELTRPKPGGLFASKPWLKWVLIAVLIGVVVLVVVMFLPGFLNASKGAIKLPGTTKP